MKMRRHGATTAMGLLLWIACPALSPASLIDQPVTVGEPALSRTGNCDPFGCPQMFGLEAYLQVYAASAFQGPLDIQDVAFFDTRVHNGGAPASGSFSLYFSYTSMVPGGINLQSMGAWPPPGMQPFFSGSLPSLADHVLDISGNPFVYNPALGNLLLTVTVSGAQDSFWPLFLDQAAGTDQTTNAYFGVLNGRSISGGNEIGGLLTQFNHTGAAPAPEPGSIFLIAAGMGLIGFRFLRTKR